MLVPHYISYYIGRQLPPPSVTQDHSKRSTRLGSSSTVKSPNSSENCCWHQTSKQPPLCQTALTGPGGPGPPPPKLQTTSTVPFQTLSSYSTTPVLLRAKLLAKHLTFFLHCGLHTLELLSYVSGLMSRLCVIINAVAMAVVFVCSLYKWGLLLLWS